MIIYSVTIKIDLSAHNEWLKWMKEEHIPEVIEKGKFVGSKFHKVLNEDESDGVTYNVQFSVNSIGDYFEYRDNHAPELQQKSLAKFSEKYVAFRTLLREVE